MQINIRVYDRIIAHKKQNIAIIELYIRDIDFLINDIKLQIRDNDSGYEDNDLF